MHPVFDTSSPQVVSDEVTEIPSTDVTDLDYGQEDVQDHLTFAPQPLPDTKRKQIKGKKGKLDMHRFENIQPESVDSMPWDVAGNGIYLISCTEEFWHDRQQDGWHWQFMTSSKKGLDGIRKFGTCMGSNICMNPKCPLFTTEGIRNEIDFKTEDYGGYIYNSCGYLVRRKFCGCIKVTQFDH